MDLRQSSHIDCSRITSPPLESSMVQELVLPLNSTPQIADNNNGIATSSRLENNIESRGCGSGIQLSNSSRSP